MTYYLYVKTHNETGMKYLGHTKSCDPYSYSGSGVYWKKHLSKHGKNYKTEILLKTESKDELIETALFFSSIFRVDESIEWANLVKETGPGGNIFHRETIEKTMQTKMIKYGSRSYNNREKCKETLSRVGVVNVSQMDVVKKKISKSLSGVNKSETHKASMRKPKSENGRLNISKAKKRKTIIHGDSLVTDSKKYCEERGYNYQVFMRYANQKKLYKGYVPEIVEW